MPSLSQLFPSRRISWLIWVFILIIMLPLYYFDPDFYQAFHREYNKGWQRCPWSATDCAIKKGDLAFSYSVPRYVTDFWEMPLTIQVMHNLPRRVDDVSIESIAHRENKNVVISVELVPTIRANEVFIYTEESPEQNSITLSIPPGGEATATFYIRAYDQNSQTAPVYRPQISLYGEPIGTPLNYTIQPNRQEIFKLWLIKYFLVPPGINVVIPLGALLLVWLGEANFDLAIRYRRVWQKTRKSKQTGNFREFVAKVYGDVVVAVVLTLVLVIGVHMHNIHNV